MIEALERAAGRPVSRETAALLEAYVERLKTANSTQNLVSASTLDNIWERHILDCAQLVRFEPHAGASWVDIGSGAGLPGLVWAIARPDLAVTLIEPLLRRTIFLDEVIEDLGLTNARVVRARAAEISETFDVVTARAVADLGKLAGWCLPLVRPGGLFLALKGESAPAEVAMWTEALRRDGATDIVVTSYGDLEKPTTVVEVSR